MKKLLSAMLVMLLIFNFGSWTSIYCATTTAKSVKQSSTSKNSTKSSTVTSQKKATSTNKVATSKTNSTKSKKTSSKKQVKKSTASKSTARRVTSRKLVASRGVAGYGELLDWWTSASKIFSIGSTAKVIDIDTGKSFYVIRTYGHNHADVEAKSKEDTEIIKDIWGGFNWDRRAVIVEIDGRRIAASMTAMPHAGVDSEPTGKIVSGRSGGFGTGENLDKIKGNGMNGHMDIHFLNSTRHKDGASDRDHQEMVKKAAGLR